MTASSESVFNLPAREIMTPDPVCATPNMPLRALAQLLDGGGVSGVPVVDHQRRVVGVVSRTDLLRACLERAENYEPAFLFELLRDEEEREEAFDFDAEYAAPDLRVEDFMTEDPITASPDAPLRELARCMAQEEVHRVVIVDDDGVALGIVTSMDVMRALAQTAGEGRRTL